MASQRKLAAVAIFAAAWVFWILAIWSGINSGFFENEYAVQMMVLGGAISMVAGAVAEMW
jgi:hypothetical protein